MIINTKKKEIIERVINEKKLFSMGKLLNFTFTKWTNYVTFHLGHQAFFFSNSKQIYVPEKINNFK